MPSGPMLLTAGPPQFGAGWLLEPKLDGARALARVAGGQVCVQSRPGNSFTARFPEIAASLADCCEGRRVIVDGEIVVLDHDGLPSFSRLQRRLVAHRPTLVHQRTMPARLWLFDVLHIDGRDLTDLPYAARRAMLADLIPQRGPTLAVAPSWGGEEAAALLQSAVELGIEGTVSKRADSRYLPGRRSRSWIKSPLRQRVSLLVAGYVRGRSTPVGALILAGHDPAGRLRYAATVSAGLGPRISRTLFTLFDPLRSPDPPWGTTPCSPNAEQSALVWLQPRYRAAIDYREATPSGRLRHASFKGLAPIDDPITGHLPLPVPRRR